jgi:hypothetical protein
MQEAQSKEDDQPTEAGDNRHDSKRLPPPHRPMAPCRPGPRYLCGFGHLI